MVNEFTDTQFFLVISYDLLHFYTFCGNFSSLINVFFPLKRFINFIFSKKERSVSLTFNMIFWFLFHLCPLLFFMSFLLLNTRSYFFLFFQVALGTMLLFTWHFFTLHDRFALQLASLLRLHFLHPLYSDSLYLLLR